MTMRLASALVLAGGVAALASASAYAGNGNGNGNGNGKSEPTAVLAVAEGQQSSGHGNAADAPGQLKKDVVPTPALLGSSVTPDAGTAQAGVKPSSDTAHDTHAAASSDQTKLYGNGKTAGQIAIRNGAAPSTVLHGPGNSQPHKAALCAGGHEVDVHALEGKRDRACGTQPSSPPTPRPKPIPDPGKPGHSAQGPNVSGSTPATAPTSQSALPVSITSTKPVVHPKQGGVESGSGVLSAAGAIGGGTLPFTGFPLWVVALAGLVAMALGLIMRRGSGAPSR
jgi:hypothetical protein